VDIHLDSENVSRSHAAVVHHINGNPYIIDLQSVRSAVHMSGVHMLWIASARAAQYLYQWHDFVRKCFVE
jgi:hypothetical protein